MAHSPLHRLDLVAAPRRRRVGMDPSHLHAIRTQRIRSVHCGAVVWSLPLGCVGWAAGYHSPARLLPSQFVSGTLALPSRSPMPPMPAPQLVQGGGWRGR